MSGRSGGGAARRLVEQVMTTTAMEGAALATGQAPRTDRGMQSLRSEDFFKLLVTELQHQDPLEPSKTADMISQVSQIRSIELSGSLNKTLDQLAQQQHLAGTSDMLGKFVQAEVADAGGTVSYYEGVVTGVRFDADGTGLLELDNGVAIPASAVTNIMTPERAAQLAAATQQKLGQSAAPGGKPAASKPSSVAAQPPEQTSGPPQGRASLLPWMGLEGWFRL